MADEITMSGGLRLANGFLTYPQPSISQNADQATQRYYADVQNIGTSPENLVMGSVTTIGWCFFKNLDPTNYVTLGGTTDKPIRVPPSKFVGPVHMGGVSTIVALANTAAVNLHYVIFEA